MSACGKVDGHLCMHVHNYAEIERLQVFLCISNQLQARGKWQTIRVMFKARNFFNVFNFCL